MGITSESLLAGAGRAGWWGRFLFLSPVVFGVCVLILTSGVSLFISGFGALRHATETAGGGKNVEEFARSKGEEVKRVSGDVFALEKLLADHPAGDIDVGRGEVAEDGGSA